jgi:hypothetical protein
MALPGPQVAELLRTRTAPVTSFACGTLCAPGNGGVRVCCHAEQVLPVLYKAELALLQKRSQLWREHVPSGPDAALRDTARACDVFALCKGHTQCERDNRSLACRTFPFEPYLDHHDRFAGIVFAYDFAHLCPRITSSHAITDEFVAQCCAMWERMFAFGADERRFYAGCSRTLRAPLITARAPAPAQSCTRTPRPDRARRAAVRAACR